ncbi:MAG: hypothetical protein V1691_03160 [Chloroflexota bacterium]
MTGYKWTQTAGTKATIDNVNSDTIKVTLGDDNAYKDQIIANLETQDRFVVQAINPHSLIGAQVATFKVTVTTSSGTYSDTINVTANLPYVFSTGIDNVPTNVGVLLHGKNQASYNWSLAAPGSSKSALDSATDQNPSFIPDAVGKYTLTEKVSGATLTVYAGTWVGAISSIDADGKPLSAACTACHNGTIAPDQFATWKETGHAAIFTKNIDNPAGHWSLSCAECHGVGYNPDATNGGWDEAIAAAKWTPPSHGEPGLWTEIVKDYPNIAKLGNIQCENCHGPNNSPAHTSDTAARVSLSSDVCGACHGEPARHGRFQQWEESGHGNFEAAIAEGMNASCTRCHSAQGFMAWLPELEAGNLGNLKAPITWTADTVQPQTCVVCHDPHDEGMSSGEPNTATVRVTGDTPMLPAGFQAVGVGRGAICITCHNTRNGAHNDVASTTMDDRAPHTAAQGDVLMGQNAYFVTTGVRSPHSYLEDTCATCHMEETPPPADLSYQLGGTNHSFAASMEICGNCHGDFNGGTLQTATATKLEELKADIENAIMTEIKAQIAKGNNLTLVALGDGGADVTISDASTITSLDFIESHGRQAMEIVVGGKTYDVRLASDTKVGSGTLLSSPAGQTIAKVGWNYFLLEGDASEGVHNPSFTNEVLNASIAALK